jgi:hypothetical protein
MELRLIYDKFTVSAKNQGSRYLVFAEVTCTSEMAGLLSNPAINLNPILLFYCI